ncbi:hypothetical protein IEO21_07319 [Rhodonia placenta]|uniref:Uncharacterized protein n=1 Tax=Rhodonia placenta TaxID=104341 RepID=A0A8H7NYA4_9APHY|nr:hypothetical protein IEO21_07319 [Postia placenta]
MHQPDPLIVLSPNARTPKPDVIIWNPKNRIIMFGQDYESFQAVMRDELNREKVDVSRFKSATNIMTMRSDLAKLFYENKFSIDVDDNYRIVFFQDPDELECSSESMSALTGRDYHWTPPTPDGAFQPDKDLLRRHFRHSLRVNLCGNDIHFYLTRNQIQAFWDRFNGDSDHADIIKPTAYAEWNTLLGSCCREWQRLDKLAELDDRLQGSQIEEED